MAQASGRPPAGDGLAFPFAQTPASGELVEVAPGLWWARFALPFRLNHVNVYLIEDGAGVAILDTGLMDGATQADWTRLLQGPLKGRAVTRIIATHFHPDHVGAAGWLHEKTGAPLAMTLCEYLMSGHLRQDSRPLYGRFYREHGLDPRTIASLATDGHRYLDLVSTLPERFSTICAGEILSIGARRFEILTGGGHSPDLVMLHCGQDNLFLASDQVLATISPNISVHPLDPDADPLGAYMASLSRLRATVAPGALVLPGHHQPFYGLHSRIDELVAHHEARCGLVVERCAEAPQRAAELMRALFPKVTDPHQMGFAFGETLAHVNYLVRRGRLVRDTDAQGIVLFRAGD